MQRRDAEGVGGRVPDEPVGGPGPFPVRPLPGTSVVRADDLLDLRFEFRNLGLRRTGRPALVRVDPDAEAFVIVWFPPQSVGEETLLDLEGAFPLPAALSGPSRLAFRIPAQVTAIPFDLDGLLEWTAWSPSLAPTALGLTELPAVPGLAPAEPDPTATAIEAPFRLVLSPARHGRWAAARRAVTRAGVTELWHARLVARKISLDGEAADRILRPVWTPDRLGPVPLSTALSADDRLRIVNLGGDLSRGGNVPAPIRTRVLALSARGAWLDVAGEWPVPDPRLPPVDFSQLLEDAERLVEAAAEERVPHAQVVTFLDQTVDRFIPAGAPDVQLALRRDLLEFLRQSPSVDVFATELLAGIRGRDVFGWSHRLVQGRDDAVRVVTPGFLYPWGHPVTLEVVTTREFVAPALGTFTTALVKRALIHVREPLRDYRPRLGGYPNQGRETPFFSARLLDDTSRPVRPLSATGWLVAPDGTDLRWTVACEDRAGRVVTMTMPLLFVPGLDGNGRPVDPASAISLYATDPRRHVDVAGQQVAFVESARDEGSLVARRISFDGVRGPGSPATAGFLPSVTRAEVSLPAVAALLGTAGVPSSMPVEWEPAYLRHGFDAAGNAAQLFARVPEGALVPKLASVAERAGGLMRPELAVEGLSRLLGPVPDVRNVVLGKLNPASFLPDVKILGGYSLRSLVAEVVSGITPGDLGALADLAPDALWHSLRQEATRLPMPALTTRRLRDAAGVPTAVETRFVWKPDLKRNLDLPAGLKLNPAARLAVQTSLRAPLDGTPPSFASRGELADFSFSFADVVVSLASLEFHARDGRKLEVSASGVALRFEGKLAFVEEIRRYFPPEGFSDPPWVTVAPGGITAGFSLGLPAIGVGVFSFENVAFSASLELPFVERAARLRFALSERHDPFLVTVSLFGGGGFLAIAVDTGGGLEVEAAIEFGGNFSLDIVVASGGVHVLAGIYFRLGAAEVELSGYLRAGGAVTVLGVITLTVEFYLALTFHHRAGPPEANLVSGEASLTVGVEVLFLRQDVTLRVHREFANPVGDPTFEDLVSPEAWVSYCDAFAA